MAGQPCMRWPIGVAYCDHGEQMVPPVKALGSEYVGVMFRPRVTGDQAIWHMVGAVDGTTLTYSSAVGGPATLDAGQVVDFITATPFDVKSQDAQPPLHALHVHERIAVDACSATTTATATPTSSSACRRSST